MLVALKAAVSVFSEQDCHQLEVIPVLVTDDPKLEEAPSFVSRGNTVFMNFRVLVYGEWCVDCLPAQDPNPGQVNLPRTRPERLG